MEVSASSTLLILIFQVDIAPLLRVKRVPSFLIGLPSRTFLIPTFRVYIGTLLTVFCTGIMKPPIPVMD